MSKSTEQKIEYLDRMALLNALRDDPDGNWIEIIHRFPAVTIDSIRRERENPQDRNGFFALVDAERSRQNAKWGYPQRNTFCEWGCILGEEFGEAAKELNELNFGRGSKERLVEELVHTAAVCLSIVEHFDVANAYATEPKEEAKKDNDILSDSDWNGFGIFKKDTEPKDIQAGS